MKSVSIIFLLIGLKASSQNLTTYVNPFIGTGGHGHTYPGASVPFGFVQLSPDTRPDGYNDWDGCGGYHYSDSIIYGFSHTHLSGTGVADYCDILLMPTVGEPQLNNIKNNDPKQGYASKFSHETEKASPGYYAVLLEDDKIPVELTTTARTGMHKYQFPDTGKINIILDLTHRDKLVEGSFIEIISPTKIQGLRRSSSWAKDQWLYFAIEFSEPFQYAEIMDNGNTEKVRTQQFSSKIISGTQLKSFFQFLGDGGKTITVKCALSPVNCAGAWKNMQAEIPHWDFEKVKKETNDIWNKELSKITVTSIADENKSLAAPDNKLVIFYTALYHCMLAPNIYEDVDGKYRGRDNTIHVADNFDYYTVFSLWDTFRALHPLLTIIDQKRTNDFINTFLKQYEQGGRLPVWELSSNETECMIGYHSVSVIADAAVKEIRGYDMHLALEAMKHSANLDHFGLKFYKEKGFIESNEEAESVSRTLEYSYDDWCIGQMSALIYLYDRSAENRSELEYYNKRSLNFKNVMDGNYARPRFNGGWYSPFDPAEVNFNYTEANAWQYSTFAPQSNFPVNEIFLDSIFNAPSITKGRQQSDITGLIGQYAHGNEPSHNLAYLYNYTYTAPWKTQFYLNKIINDFYKNRPDGLIGNEDCGQMSAWYVLSSIGLYPVSPGRGNYDFGLPIFDTVKIALENGKSFIINTKNNSPENIYLESVKFSNAPISKLQLEHALLSYGGVLTFNKTADPKKCFNPANSDFNKYKTPVAAPIISASNISFSDSLKVTIGSTNSGGYIHFTNNGDDPSVRSQIIYGDSSFYITETTTIKAIHCGGTDNSPAISCTGISTAHFTKLPHNYTLNYISKYDSQYTAGGANALIDGMHGSSDFRTGMWQGWQKENMNVVLDLGEIQEITKVGAGFLQDVRSWIWMPATVVVYTSTDGINYTIVATINNTTETNNYESKEIKNFIADITRTKTRYVKFIAVNFGQVPDWHPGKGGDTWIFCDEVWVK